MLKNQGPVPGERLRAKETSSLEACICSLLLLYLQQSFLCVVDNRLCSYNQYQEEGSQVVFSVLVTESLFPQELLHSEGKSLLGGLREWVMLEELLMLLVLQGTLEFKLRQEYIRVHVLRTLDCVHANKADLQHLWC